MATVAPAFVEGFNCTANRTYPYQAYVLYRAGAIGNSSPTSCSPGTRTCPLSLPSPSPIHGERHDAAAACACTEAERPNFLYFNPTFEKNYVWTPRNFICKFGPDARRHSLWRRGNTARRHSLWRRGMTWQQRLPAPRADLSSMWRRHGLVARRHRSWHRATDAYKAAGREQHSSSHFKTSSNLFGFKDSRWFTS
jgi:hypothetical protein